MSFKRRLHGRRRWRVTTLSAGLNSGAFILARNLFFWYIICFYYINKLTFNAAGQKKEVRNSWFWVRSQSWAFGIFPFVFTRSNASLSEGHLLVSSTRTRSSILWPSSSGPINQDQIKHPLGIILWIHQSDPDPAHPIFWGSWSAGSTSQEQAQCPHLLRATIFWTIILWSEPLTAGLWVISFFLF